MCVQNLNFVALPVPEIIRVGKNFGQCLAVYTHTLYSQKYPIGLPYRLFIYARSFSAVCIGVLGGVANPNLGEEDVVRGRDGIV